MKLSSLFKGVIDNIRGSVSSNNSGVPSRLESEIIECCTSDMFTLEKTSLHGYPFKPTAMAFDSIQKILAVGNRHGAIRLIGRPGIETTFHHEAGSCVLQMIFVSTSGPEPRGQLLTLCADDTIYLWDIRKTVPELVQSLVFTRERVTYVHTGFKSKWVLIGTERGNVFIMNLDTMSLSGYQISWNKAIDMMQNTHPGPVTYISDNPADPSKILIGFEQGSLCLWDLPTKRGEQRYHNASKVTSVSWHHEGKQFVCSCKDGSLVTWAVRPTANKPISTVWPHKNKAGDECDEISKVNWIVSRDGDPYLIFSGGLPTDITGTTPSITVMQGKNSTVLEMDYCVLDFVLATDTPYEADYQNPESIIVLLSNDLMAIDLRSTGFPTFENPYAMDFQDSAVTCCEYLVDCPADLIPALYMVGKKARNGERWSTKEWPISGGVPSGNESVQHVELLVTGHTDGTIRFWDASSTAMQALYKVKTAKLLEKSKKNGQDLLTEDPFAITSICLDSRLMAVAGASAQVMLFKFKKKESTGETPSLEIPIIYEVSADKIQSENSPHFEFPPRPALGVASQSSSYTDPGEGFCFDKRTVEYFTPLKVRAGQSKKSAGFQADLICLTPWVNTEAPSTITCITLNATYGLMAYSNGSGLVIVDFLQQTCLLNMGTADLYGSNDPFNRVPKSPKPLSPGSAAEDCIVRVDLSNYSQVSQSTDSCDTPKEDNATPTTKDPTPKPKAPAKKEMLQKVGANSSSNEEGSFTKSRSSSVSSMDRVETAAAVEKEGVTGLHFADSFATKNAFELSSCLYVGTSLGSVVVVVITLPANGDPRLTEQVIVSPSDTLLRLKGSVMAFCLLDSSLSLSSRPEPPVNVMMTAGGGRGPASVNSLNSQGSVDSPGSAPLGDQLVLTVATEKCLAVYGLPSQRQICCQTVTDPGMVVVASIVSWGGSKFTPLLLVFTSDGVIKGYSLPSLRVMVDMNLVSAGQRPISGTDRIARTLCFSKGGNGVYFTNPNQVQKFSVNKEAIKIQEESCGTLIQENLEVPEPPKQSFLKGLFGVGPKPLDREELFGEGSGKVSATLAKNVPGNKMAELQSKAGGGTSEIAKAKQAICERGEKLSEIEDRTEQMSNEAKIFAATGHNLMQHYKNKKWYQP